MDPFRGDKPDSDSMENASLLNRLRWVLMRVGLIYNDKPGPGVKDDVPPAKGLRLFFRILFGEFFTLIRLNFLFYLFCIPVLTIPASYCAMIRIIVGMVRDQHCFLLSDFWKTFRKEFWKATIVGMSLLAVLGGLIALVWFYEDIIGVEGLYLPLAVFTASVMAMLIFVSFSLFPMISLVDLPLKKVVMNAFLLVPASIFRYMLAFFVCTVLIFLGLLFFPVTLIPIALLFPSILSLITVFSAYSGIKDNVLEDTD